MGVATQSQAFAVGNSVPFALPGHGVIATQSMAEPMYGSVGLDLLQGGFTAQEVLTALSSVDPQPQRRQVAVLGVNGDLAAYTGDQCVEAAGHLIGETSVALANMAACPAWESMVERYESSGVRSRSGCSTRCRPPRRPTVTSGDGAPRRSWSSARTPPGAPGTTWWVDLRVDDSADPVARALADPRHPGALGHRPRVPAGHRRRPGHRRPGAGGCCGRWTRSPSPTS